MNLCRLPAYESLLADLASAVREALVAAGPPPHPCVVEALASYDRYVSMGSPALFRSHAAHGLARSLVTLDPSRLEGPLLTYAKICAGASCPLPVPFTDEEVRCCEDSLLFAA